MLQKHLIKFILYFFILTNIIILPNLAYSQTYENKKKIRNEHKNENKQLFQKDKKEIIDKKLKEWMKTEKYKSTLGTIDLWDYMGSNTWNYYWIDAGPGDIDLYLTDIQWAWDLDLYLYDELGNQVAVSNYVGNSDEDIHYTGYDNQTYKIGVYAYTAGSGWGDYHLTGTYPDQALPDLIITDFSVTPNKQFIFDYSSVALPLQIRELVPQ